MTKDVYNIKEEQLLLEISLIMNKELYNNNSITYQEYLNAQEYILKKINKVSHEFN